MKVVIDREELERALCGHTGLDLEACTFYDGNGDEIEFPIVADDADEEEE